MPPYLCLQTLQAYHTLRVNQAIYENAMMKMVVVINVVSACGSYCCRATGIFARHFLYSDLPSSRLDERTDGRVFKANDSSFRQLSRD